MDSLASRSAANDLRQVYYAILTPDICLGPKMVLEGAIEGCDGWLCAGRA